VPVGARPTVRELLPECHECGTDHYGDTKENDDACAPQRYTSGEKSQSAFPCSRSGEWAVRMNAVG